MIRKIKRSGDQKPQYDRIVYSKFVPSPNKDFSATLRFTGNELLAVEDALYRAYRRTRAYGNEFHDVIYALRYFRYLCRTTHLLTPEPKLRRPYVSMNEFGVTPGSTTFEFTAKVLRTTHRACKLIWNERVITSLFLKKALTELGNHVRALDREQGSELPKSAYF